MKIGVFVNHMQQGSNPMVCSSPTLNLGSSRSSVLSTTRFPMISITRIGHWKPAWALDALYTGAFTKRETDQRVDYTDYLYVGQYLPYYICDSSVTYPEYNYASMASIQTRSAAQRVKRHTVSVRRQTCL